MESTTPPTTVSSRTTFQPEAQSADSPTLRAASLPSRTHRARARAEGRKAGLREASYAAAMQGSGESYLSAFALLLHASSLQIALLSALPQLVGTAAQLLSVRVLKGLSCRRSLIVLGASLQAGCWLPLFLLPLMLPGHAPWLLIAATALYLAVGHSTIPAWNSLMTDLLPASRRGGYFARRSRTMSVAHFVALCFAGLVLAAAETAGHPSWGFALIFLIAAIARAASARTIAQIDEAAAVEHPRPDGALLQAWARQGRHFRRFLLFSGLMYASVFLAGPFFVVYLIRDLQLGYLGYTTWLAAQVIGQFLTLKAWGRFSDRFGNKQLLVVTSLLVPFIPMLYLVSAQALFLIGVSFVGGIIWAGLALGLQNYVFDVVSAAERPKSIAIWNSANAVGWGLGALVGGWLATVMPSTLHLGSWEVTFQSNLPVIFALSGVLRLGVSLTLLRSFGEGRQVQVISGWQVVAELPLVRPFRHSTNKLWSRRPRRGVPLATGRRATNPPRSGQSPHRGHPGG